MVEFGAFILLGFVLWLIFRPNEYAPPPPPKPEPEPTPEPEPEEPEVLKDSAYYMRKFPDLLTGIPPSHRSTEIPKEPPAIIVNITNNHLHVHLNKEEDPDT